MATYEHPSQHASEIKANDIEAVVTYLQGVFDYLLFAPAPEPDKYPTLTYGQMSAAHALVYGYSTSSTDSLAFYTKLEEYFTSVADQIHNQITSGPANGTELVKHYLTISRRFDNRARFIGRILAYFGNYWVKRMEDEGKGVKPLDLHKWREYDAEKEVSETCAKAASESGIAPARPLMLRKFRLGVVEKLDLNKLIEAIRAISNKDEQESTALELRKSLWVVGVDPSKDEMKTLNALAGVVEVAAEPPTAESATDAAEPAAEPAATADD